MKKVALVTGGSRGIGLGIVLHLAKQGFDIAINGVRPQASVSDVLEQVSSLGVEVLYCQGNVALQQDRVKILEEVKLHFGQLNVLVNNAGIAPRERRDVLETTENSFDEVLDTNLKSCYFLTQAAANWMITQKKEDADFFATIINVSSISATVASVNRGEYCVSKAGISMVTQLFAVRLGEFDIPVYEVRPGVIQTDMTAGVTAKYDQLIQGGLCVQPRWGMPDDVGRAVAALTAGALPYSTGQVIMVDGGLTLSRL